jgi:uncharacterized protein YbjT (DUF2867 family)
MILVIGATGSLGGRITRGLLAQGRNVRIVSRNNPLSAELAAQGRATPAESLIEAGAEAVYADLKAPDSLETAVAGIDTVITTAAATQRGGEDTLPAVDLQGTLSLIEAAKAAGVKRFIYTSIYGAAPDHPSPIHSIKGTCEAALEKSGMEYTILRPNIFMEVWIGMIIGVPLMAGQPISLIGKGDHPHNFVSEADVADFALAAVDNPRAANQGIDTGGPASYTWTQVVETAGRVMGRDLPVQYLPPGSELPLLPPLFGEFMSSMENSEVFIDMTETAPAYGVTLTTLEEFIEETFVNK